jgi:hypothetical protein
MRECWIAIINITQSIGNKIEYDDRGIDCWYSEKSCGFLVLCEDSQTGRHFWTPLADRKRVSGDFWNI